MHLDPTVIKRFDHNGYTVKLVQLPHSGKYSFKVIHLDGRNLKQCAWCLGYKFDSVDVAESVIKNLIDFYVEKGEELRYNRKLA